MPRAGPHATLAGWAAAVAVLTALASLWLWTARDDFIDREEGQHVLRTFATDQRLGRAWHGGSVRELFGHTREDDKPWYGWPYYLASTLALRGLGARAVAPVVNLAA